MENINKKSRILTLYIIVIILLFGLIIASICIGSMQISPREVFSLIFMGSGDDTSYRIVWDIRLPRIIAALILGGALSVSGFLLQTFFQNPIAGPFVLGISSGAKLIVALSMIICLDRGINLSSWGMVIAAFAGSIIATGFVLIISFRTNKMSQLIICGILIGYICSAITDFMVTFASDSNIVNLHNWSLGSLSGMSWSDVYVMAAIVIVTFIICFFLSKPIGAYQMGESYAKSLGVNVRLLRIAIILFSSLLSACVTAFAGPISFVGIAIPHLIKLLFGSSKPIIIIPGCFLGGALVTLLCDLIARTLFAPTELSISSVTAVLLVPVVIAMMLGRERGKLG